MKVAPILYLESDTRERMITPIPKFAILPKIFVTISGFRGTCLRVEVAFSQASVSLAAYLFTAAGHLHSYT
jgi:hypothetical protein